MQFNAQNKLSDINKTSPSSMELVLKINKNNSMFGTVLSRVGEEVELMLLFIRFMKFTECILTHTFIRLSLIRNVLTFLQFISRKAYAELKYFSKLLGKCLVMCTCNIKHN